MVRIYGLRPWVEQSYKQVKDELGWADFQVRSPIAIRRHQELVNCAFSFPGRPGPSRRWQAWSKAPPPAELQHLLDTVTAGHGLYLYLPP